VPNSSTIQSIDRSIQPCSTGRTGHFGFHHHATTRIVLHHRNRA
jgi:hypothetical protein